MREAELARRILHAAKADGSLPQGYDPGLLALRDRRPHPNTPAEIAASAAEVTDPNFRIEVAEDGIHVYNRDGHQVATDPFALFPQLAVEQDGGHAFYLGVELARAQIAHQLGKRYVQDNELRWGCAVPPPTANPTAPRRARQHAGGAAQGPPPGALMPVIRESIVTTRNADGSAHVAPLGVIVEPPFLVIAPFHPSTTLDQSAPPPVRLRQLHDRRADLRRLRHAPAAATGRSCRRNGSTAGGWPVRWRTARSRWRRWSRTRSARASAVASCTRPATRRFTGLNRAQAAVLEAAILVSRLQMLPRAEDRAGAGLPRDRRRQDGRRAGAGGVAVADGRDGGGGHSPRQSRSSASRRRDRWPVAGAGQPP